MTGRFNGFFQGRPVEINAEGEKVTIQVADLAAAWSLRSNVSNATLAIRNLLKKSGIRIRLQIGAQLTLSVIPDTSLIVRVLCPTL